MTTHTAWLTTSSSCLTGDVCDLSVLDQDSNAIDVWDTAVPHEDPTRGHLFREAQNLLYDNGWRLTSTWDANGTGYVATVERAES